ncbi:MAG: hypothetical protein ACNI27_06435 [Desulfovibrio sp.]
MFYDKHTYQTFIPTLILCMIFVITYPTLTHAKEPKLQEKKVVAYLESGEYWEFTELYEKTLEKLIKLRIREKLVFPPELHISMKVAEDSALLAKAAELMSNPDIDLILAMGTHATAALLKVNNKKTPIVSVAVSDPEGMGFVDPYKGTVASNLTIHYIKDQWNIMFRTLSAALKVKRLGIMYTDTPEGRTFSNVQAAREIGRESGYTLIEYPYIDKEESYTSSAEGIDALIKAHIDTFYVPELTSFDWDTGHPEVFINELHRNGVKTFTRNGSTQVRNGVLMGLALTTTSSLATFYADTIGRKLGLLPINAPTRHVKETPIFTINLVAAKELNMDFPLSLLVATDLIYDNTLPVVKNLESID